MVNPDPRVGPQHLPTARLPRPRANTLRLEPLVGLEWSHALEMANSGRPVRKPADARRAWVHRAPEEQVLALFRTVRADDSDSASPYAPWWLRVLADGGLTSRSAAFAFEDAVAELLASRSGWVYVSWGGHSEDGFWEYTPSETGTSGFRSPTSITLTHRHPWWLDMIPAHTPPAPAPVPLSGVEGLRASLDDIERRDVEQRER